MRHALRPIYLQVSGILYQEGARAEEIPEVGVTRLCSSPAQVPVALETGQCAAVALLHSSPDPPAPTLRLVFEAELATRKDTRKDKDAPGFAFEPSVCHVAAVGVEVRRGGLVGVRWRVEGCNGETSTSISQGTLAALLAELLPDTSSLISQLLAPHQMSALQCLCGIAGRRAEGGAGGRGGEEDWRQVEKRDKYMLVMCSDFYPIKTCAREYLKDLRLMAEVAQVIGQVCYVDVLRPEVQEGPQKTKKEEEEEEEEEVEQEQGRPAKRGAPGAVEARAAAAAARKKRRSHL